MATFGRDVDVFQQIAGGNLQALKELVISTSSLVKQPLIPAAPAKIATQSDLPHPATTADKSL
ncbi:MAG: hypothetical protein V7604_4680 [Hyphomicrobiales bacterium]|jgi:hypothetical protein